MNIFEQQELKTHIYFKKHNYASLGTGGESEGKSLLGPLHFLPWLLGMDKATSLISTSP